MTPTIICPSCGKQAGLVKEIVWHCTGGHWFVLPRRAISAEYDVVATWIRMFVRDIRWLRDNGVIRHWDDWYPRLMQCLEPANVADQLIALAQFGVEFETFRKEALCATKTTD